MSKRRIIIATRESPLALRQAEWVKTALLAIYPSFTIDFLRLTTKADKMLNTTLQKIGGKGLFVKELEEALLDKRADIAVHSMKDVPMNLPSGLILPVICERVDPRDVLVATHYHSLKQLPTGSKVGTASLRRQTQLYALRADIEISDLRGNVNSRLLKLEKGEFDALVLAAAGLARLECTEYICEYFSPMDFLPAAGQGALGIQCREEDETMLKLIVPLNHQQTNDCVRAERAVCRRLEGGCLLPIAAYAQYYQGNLMLRGLVANRKGTHILRAQYKGDAGEADKIGEQVAEELIRQGAKKILREFHDF